MQNAEWHAERPRTVGCARVRAAGCRPALTVAVVMALALAVCDVHAVAGEQEAAADVLRGDSERVVDLTRLFPDMDAAFVLLDVQARRVTRHNPARARQRFLPASTYKIPNSIIALETAVATGPEFELPWNPAAASPQPWWPEAWTRDQDLRSAFRQSVVWYYQELARRIGPERMQAYLRRFGYGNQEISPAIDRFWLSGDLRISPDEQVAFLERFLSGQLGVSPRTTAIVQDLMRLEETPGYRLFGKTGTADVTPTRELGWLVGYVERGGATYVYALNIEGERVWEDWGPSTRKGLVVAVLQALDILP
jgi:beta-lactamase class D